MKNRFLKHLEAYGKLMKAYSIFNVLKCKTYCDIFIKVKNIRIGYIGSFIIKTLSVM